MTGGPGAIGWHVFVTESLRIIEFSHLLVRHVNIGFMQPPIFGEEMPMANVPSSAWNKRRCVLAACGFTLVVGVLPSLSPAKAGELAPPPRAEDIDSGALRDSVRAALACGVNFLLRRAETNDAGFVMEPARKRAVVEQRYSVKTIQEPVYEYTYENYETFEYVKGASATDGGKLQKVVRSRATGRRQVGTHQVERTVGDTNGTIVTTNVYDTIWQSGFLGQNAAALYALRTCGVPETNEGVARLSRTLDNSVTAYGLPDATWDLAWLTAALCRMSAKDFKNNRDRIINRLLEGQITEGPARGLWGPVCINGELVGAVVAYEQTLNDELAKRRQRLAQAPDSRLIRRRVEEVEFALTRFENVYHDIAQQALRFDAVMAPLAIVPYLSSRGCEYPVIARGLPFYIYNQTLADLETTALALFALREAAEHGCLPEKTARPEVSAGQPILPPQETVAILARAAAAIVSLQKADGTWDEANLNPASAAYKGLATKSPLMKVEKAQELESRRTLLSVAQGFSALQDAGYAVGMSKLVGKYWKNLCLGQEARRSAAAAYLDNQTNAMPVGGLAPPYELFAKLSGVDRLCGTNEADRRDLWDRLAYRLVMLQQPDGTWGQGAVLLQPSSVWAKQDALYREMHAESQKNTPENKRKPYNPADYQSKHRWWSYDGVYVAPLCTVYSLLFLADGLRETAAGPATNLLLAATTNAVDPFLWRVAATNRLIASRPLAPAAVTNSVTATSQPGNSVRPHAKPAPPPKAKEEEPPGLPAPPKGDVKPNRSDEVR